MIVLTAIGRFFKKIWDWIKQTAWIQPLLIVGIIFGVIFSIPSIVKAIDAAKEKKDGMEVYYLQYQCSLEGEKSSDAYKLTDAIYKNDADNVKVDGKKADKFFLVYVSESCTECAQIKGAFQVLEERLSSKENAIFHSDDNTPFKLVTIFTDQDTTVEYDNNETAFGKYLEDNQAFFEDAGSRAWNTDYFDGGNLNQSDLEYMISADKNMFLTPTIMLVDMSPAQEYIDRGYEAGVTEIMFGVSGSSDYERAEMLLDCWNHDGKFDRNANK